MKQRDRDRARKNVRNNDVVAKSSRSVNRIDRDNRGNCYKSEAIS